MARAPEEATSLEELNGDLLHLGGSPITIYHHLSPDFNSFGQVILQDVDVGFG